MAKLIKKEVRTKKKRKSSNHGETLRTQTPSKLLRTNFNDKNSSSLLMSEGIVAI